MSAWRTLGADPDGAAREARKNAALYMRCAIDRAVTRYAIATGNELQDRPAWPGAVSMYQYAEPAIGIRAAVIARDSADRVRDEYVRRARQDGMSWRAVGEALGLDQGEEGRTGYDLGVAAYEMVAGEPDIRRQPSFAWGCPSCGQTVSDREPYEAHPEDNEHGHVDRCERLAADVATYRARAAKWEAELEAE